LQGAAGQAAGAAAAAAALRAFNASTLCLAFAVPDCLSLPSWCLCLCLFR
jgi:hypothetical protein